MENNNCTVSIVVAIYKSENFLPKLIDSLIKQTYRNLEIILVDDGSPDNSGVICDKYAKLDTRIKVIHKTNGGACEARNYGLKASTGQYVVIVDGDDWLELDFVSYMLNLIKTTGAQMALSDKLFTTRDRKQILRDHVEIWSSEEACTKIIYPYMKLGPWNKIYNRKLLENNDITFSVPWFGEGLYFATMAASYANFVAVGHRKVYNYRLNNVNSGLNNFNVQNGINALGNIYTLNDCLPKHTKNIDNALKWHIWKNYSFLLMQIIGTKTVEQNIDLYKLAYNYIKQHFVSILVRSKINFKERAKVFFCGLMPIIYTKFVIAKQSIARS